MELSVTRETGIHGDFHRGLFRGSLAQGHVSMTFSAVKARYRDMPPVGKEDMTGKPEQALPGNLLVFSRVLPDFFLLRTVGNRLCVTFHADRDAGKRGTDPGPDPLMTEYAFQFQFLRMLIMIILDRLGYGLRPAREGEEADE